MRPNSAHSDAWIGEWEDRSGRLRSKLRKGRTGYLRFGLASPCREDNAPMGRRKDIAATLAICRVSIQINGLFQDWRR